MSVIIKAIPSWTNESNIACMFSFEEKVDDPQNHCVPVWDVFASPTEAHLLFLVMPLLRAFNDPPFAAVEEVVDFVDQILQVRTPLSPRLPSYNIHLFTGYRIYAPQWRCPSRHHLYQPNDGRLRYVSRRFPPRTTTPRSLRQNRSSPHDEDHGKTQVLYYRL